MLKSLTGASPNYFSLLGAQFGELAADNAAAFENNLGETNDLVVGARYRGGRWFESIAAHHTVAIQVANVRRFPVEVELNSAPPAGFLVATSAPTCRNGSPCCATTSSLSQRRCTRSQNSVGCALRSAVQASPWHVRDSISTPRSQWVKTIASTTISSTLALASIRSARAEPASCWQLIEPGEASTSENRRRHSGSHGSGVLGPAMTPSKYGATSSCPPNQPRVIVSANRAFDHAPESVGPDGKRCTGSCFGRRSLA
jgi:hypothetical protein